jgi:hypothetical protein
MAEVTWWLPTQNNNYSSRNLWVRVVEMGFLPDDGDHVHITGSEEEPDGDVAAYVKGRYWNLDGSAHLQFQTYVIDPPDDFRPNRIMTSWWTDRDGDLEAALARSGWLTYEEWKSRAKTAS